VPARTIKKWANEGQQWVFERGAAPTLLAGGINSGKTVGCVIKSLTLLDKYKNSRLAVVRRSYTQLLKTTMETWYQWCSPRMYDKGGRTEAILTLNNGSKIYFIHLDQPDSLDLLAGLELNFAYISQMEEISEKAFDLLDVRVGRWTGAVIPEEDYAQFGGVENWPWKSQEDDVCVPPRYIYGEGYVTDEAHWLYDRFAEESPNREKWRALGYESKIVNSEQNIYAIKANIDAALSKDDDYIRRYVRPVWGNPEGRIFTIDPSSILEPEPWLIERITRTMKLHRSLDHGDFAPTVCLWHGTDYDGNIFTYREYYQGDELISNHRQAIFELSKADFGGNFDGIPRYHSNLADPSITGKSRGRTATSKPEWSVYDDYTDTKLMPKETVIRWTESVNDPVATVSRMKEYLKVDPNHIHPVTKKKGAPHLYFIKATNDYPHGCRYTLRDIRAQMRPKAKIGDREIWLDGRDDTIIDHGYDAEKYFVISRPSLGPMQPEEPLPLGTIKISDYEKASEYIRYRKRLQERRLGVAKSGWGMGG